MTRTAIIGGGISGLTLALLLRDKGHSVRVFEASDQPGGAIRTTRSPDGWMAEWGPNTIIESSGRIKRLVSMLHLEERRRYPDQTAKKRYIVRDGRMVAVPGSAGELLSTALLSTSAKLSILREPFRRRSRNDHDETLADFVRRRLGDEFLKWPIDALVGGIYAGDPERLSVRHAFPRLALLEEQHGSLILGQIKGGVRRPPGSDEIPRNKAEIFSFDDGLQVLPDTISSRLGDAVSFQSPVQKITAINGNTATGETADRPPRWRVHVNDPLEAPQDFDVLIYAGTSYGLSGIDFPETLAPLLTPVTEIPHPPVVSFTMGFRRSDISHPLDGFGMLIPGIEGFPILGTLFTSTLFPNRAPDDGQVTLTTYMGGSRQPEIAGAEEEEQGGMVVSTLRKLLGLSGEPRFRHRILWSRAIPQYETGFARFLTLMDRAEQEHPGFYLAGNYRTGISVGDTINAAFDLAERIQQEES
ncbi:MAG: protoporphyrinogen oxidase [Balneolaceae bacterium]|nr:MAG: protoporphyrinogen oxidase [Balneolaceae bacterium]